MKSKFKFPEANKEEIKKKTISSLSVCSRGFKNRLKQKCYKDNMTPAQVMAKECILWSILINLQFLQNIGVQMKERYNKLICIIIAGTDLVGAQNFFLLGLFCLFNSWPLFQSLNPISRPPLASPEPSSTKNPLKPF